MSGRIGCRRARPRGAGCQVPERDPRESVLGVFYSWDRTIVSARGDEKSDFGALPTWEPGRSRLGSMALGLDHRFVSGRNDDQGPIFISKGRDSVRAISSSSSFIVCASVSGIVRAKSIEETMGSLSVARPDRPALRAVSEICRTLYGAWWSVFINPVLHFS